jgi:pimeloyl-ACP methyl ester carboxylesterase
MEQRAEGRTESRSAGAERAALILIPGLLNDAELWRDQVSGLSGIATCHIADITKGGTLRELAQSVLADAPARFALAGFSLGGYVAQEIARLAHDRITRLALLDTSFRSDTSERLAGRHALNKAALAPGRFHGFGDRLLTTYLDPSHVADERIVARIRAMTERLGAETFVRQNSIERKDGTNVLRSLTCPVMILCGENDRVTPLADHYEMARLVPQAKLVVMPGSGHMTPLENPAAVIEALRDWLLEPYKDP